MNVAESPSRSRRSRLTQLERSRRRRRQGIGAAAAVMVLVASVLGVGAWRDRNSGASHHRGASVALGTTAGTGTTPDRLARIVGAKPPRPLSHDAPLRVWVGGDSLAGELGPSLGNELAPTGIVRTTVDFKVGSGLHDNGLRNWPVRVPTQMSEYTPDVAIFMIGANDASIVGSDTAAWEPGYRAKVSTMMDLLGGANHRTVYWVGPPTMGSSSLDRGAKALSALMADEAKHHLHVVYVDAYAMFSGPDGGYSSHLDLPALHKTDVLVRIGDGVHFTDNGASWIAYNLARLLDQQWQITSQAGGAALTVTIESGGGSIPGYRPTYRPRYYPTTAAPTTASTVPPTVASTTVGRPPTSATTPHTTVSVPPSTSPTTVRKAPPST